MSETGGRELESQLREHYRTMPTDSSRDLIDGVARALDRAPRRRRTPFVLRSLAGLAATAVVLLTIGAVFAGMGRAPSGAPSGSPAIGASPCMSPGPIVTSGTFAAGTGASVGPRAGQTGITRAEAVAAVERFIGRKLGQADVGDPTVMASGTWLQVMEAGPTGVDAWVDAATGRVTSLLMMPVPATTTMTLDLGQAQAAAAAFLTAHSIPFQGLTPTVTIEDHGCCKFYVVTWQRYVNGATVPDVRIVKLDPSNGAVFSFMDTRASYGPVSSPAIGREEAVRLATVASGYSDPLVGTVELKADGSPFWPGRMVWSVQFDERAGASFGAAIVYVDAITGEARVVARG